MTLPGGIGLAGVVLLGVFIVGVLAGRAKRRWVLLVVGLVVVVVAGTAIALSTAPPGASTTRVQEYALVLPGVVPLAVAFLAGWVCGRASWFLRIVVVAAAALLLAVFPYPAAAEALARVLPL